jgi:hypothetical protein
MPHFCCRFLHDGEEKNSIGPVHLPAEDLGCNLVERLAVDSWDPDELAGAKWISIEHLLSMKVKVGRVPLLQEVIETIKKK